MISTATSICFVSLPSVTMQAISNIRSFEISKPTQSSMSVPVSHNFTHKIKVKKKGINSKTKFDLSIHRKNLSKLQKLNKFTAVATIIRSEIKVFSNHHQTSRIRNTLRCFRPTQQVVRGIGDK